MSSNTVSSNEQRDRFNRAADLFLRAVDLPKAARLQFLDEACGRDAELRARVETLLARHEEGSVLDESERQSCNLQETLGSHPDGEAAEPVSVGDRVSRYRILERIGEGGMSLVYRAEDTVLGRVVALKFLAPHLENNPDAMRRFEREAKAAAALDHPNICPVYDIDQSGPRPYIAMAFLEGKTLVEILHAGALEVRAALDIAIQACHGLAAAHSKQVVHRDIKPANLFVSESTSPGRLVRILDFGIARLTEEPEITSEGLTMGTVSYIAPEQIQHSLVDGRADLWALGVVLYRMVAGELPFQGDTTRNAIAAILGADPKPLSSKRPGIPPALDTIVERTLQKDPALRYQSANALLADLQELRDTLTTEERSTGALASVAVTKQRKPWRIAELVAVACLILLVAYFALRPRQDRPTQLAEPIPFTSFIGLEGDPAISPDGTRIAFTWNGDPGRPDPDIYVQLVGSSSPLRLTHTPYGEFHPAWSPDGTQIAFLREIDYRSKLVIVSALGGPEQEIAATGEGRRFNAFDWSPAENLIAIDGDGGIVTISLPDRRSTLLTHPSRPGDRDSEPRFDPTGKIIAFIRTHADRTTELLVVPTAGGVTRQIGPSGVFTHAFCWNKDGTALVTAGHRSADGAPIRAIHFPDGQPLPLRIAIDHAASPHIRGNRLAYIRRLFNVNIWEAPVRSNPARKGTVRDEAAQSQPRLRIASSRRDHSPQVSPDGKSLLFASTRTGSVQLWRSDRDGGNVVQVTHLKGNAAGTPRWSPDGQWIAFDAALDSSKASIYVVSVNGGVPRRVTNGPAQQYLPNWSSDGRWIYYCTARDGKQNIWKAPLAGGEPVQVTEAGGWEAIASPDGRYLYYSEPSGPKTIHRLDFESGNDVAYQQLGNAGAKRYWAPGDHGIYFVNTLDDPHWIQFLNVATGQTSRVQKIGEIIDYGPPGLALSPSGDAILWVQTDQDDQDVMLVENFE